jgi:hypothetical protein
MIIPQDLFYSSKLQVVCDWFFDFSNVRRMMTFTSGLLVTS